MKYYSAFSWISASGAEVRDFLQSQLTADMRPINVGESVFTGYCQPQGRTLATVLAGCVAKNESGETWGLIVPQTMAKILITRLQKFVLRRKVKLELTDHRLLGAQEPLPPAINLSFRDGNHYWAGLPMAEPMDLTEISSLTQMHDLLMGRVWIVEETCEQFVPQMIGLENHQGISFNKGCYPGQEIVARMHYLGKPKRGLYQARITWQTSPSSMGVGAKVQSESGAEIGTLVAFEPTSRYGLMVLTHEQARQAHFLQLPKATSPCATIAEISPRH